MNKSIAIVVLIAAAAAAACHSYLSYRPVERQALERLWLEEMPLGKTAGEWVALFGEPGHISLGVVDRTIAGRPVENQYKSLYEILCWGDRGVIVYARKDPGQLENKFRDTSKFRVVNVIIPAREEIVLLKPDDTTEKIQAWKPIPIRVGDKSLRDFKPADFKKMYFFIREEKPGLYTMGKYPFSSNFTAYFVNGELQYFQMNREFGLFEVL